MVDKLNKHKERYSSWKVTLAAVPLVAGAVTLIPAPSETDAMPNSHSASTTTDHLVKLSSHIVSSEVNAQVAPPKATPSGQKITYEAKFGCNPKKDFETSQHTNPDLPTYVNRILIADLKKISQNGALGVPGKALDLSCIRTGHTVEIAGTNIRSDHSTGNAADVYEVNNEIVSATSENAKELVEEVLNHAEELDIKQVISSIPKNKLMEDSTAHIDLYQADPVAHARHVHIATLPDPTVHSSNKPEVSVLPPEPMAPSAAGKPPVHAPNTR